MTNFILENDVLTLGEKIWLSKITLQATLQTPIFHSGQQAADFLESSDMMMYEALSTGDVDSTIFHAERSFNAKEVLAIFEGA